MRSSRNPDAGGRPRLQRSIRERCAAAAFYLYKALVSPVLHSVGVGQCLYRPTCSEYGYVAVARFGIIRGSWLTLRRVLRCHPGAAGGFDPVPTSRSEQQGGESQGST